MNKARLLLSLAFVAGAVSLALAHGFVLSRGIGGSGGIPVNTGIPMISGMPQVGQTLTASNGTWSNTPTSYTYQWIDSSTGTISGATASTYVPVTGNIGNTLTVSVVAVNGFGSSLPSTSAATGTVVAAGGILSAYNDVSTNWQKAGLITIGGIPTRTQCGSTLTPSGGDDFAAIQAAINACPAGQFVLLGTGTFNITMSESLLIAKGITLRGSGTCNNGSSPYCPTLLTVSNGELMTYNSGSSCGTDTSHIVPCVLNSVIQMIPTGTFEQAWSGCAYVSDATGCSTAVDADASQGQTTIQVHSLTNFSVGTWVRIDELSGATNQTDPAGGGNVFAATDLTASSGSPATGKVAYGGAGVEDGAGYGALHDRATSEIHLVSAVGAGPCPGANCTLTFDSPLTVAYRTGHSAQVYWPTRQNGTPVPFISQAGVENMSISRATNAPIYMSFCAYCWISHVEAYDWVKGIIVSSSVRSTIVSSYVHDCADCENNGVEYPLAFDGGTTESLMTDNIIYLTGKGMVERASGGGNVISYNFQDSTFYMSNGGIGNYWLDLGINGSHYVGSHHTLFEGNYGSNCEDDDTHGNEVYHTFFRNWCAGLRRPFNDPSFSTATSVTFNASDAPVNDASGNGIGFATGFSYPYSGGTGPKRAVGSMRWAYWMAYVGNVLGESGVTTAGNGWSYQAFNENNKVIWMLGWSGCGGCSDTNLSGVHGTYYLRHGNYDYLNNSIVDFQPGLTHTLPNSFYLSSVPAFFTGTSCTYSWPWVTPTAGSPIQANSCSGSGLPARARFEAGTPFVQP